jgi:hypothetical protein
MTEEDRTTLRNAVYELFHGIAAVNTSDGVNDIKLLQVVMDAGDRVITAAGTIRDKAHDRRDAEVAGLYM